MNLSTKLGKIKLMRLTTKTNTDGLFLTVYSSINGVQERSTKDYGVKIIVWGTKNKKISRVFYFPTQDINISNNPIGDIVLGNVVISKKFQRTRKIMVMHSNER